MTDIDWTVLEIDGVLDVASRAARKVAKAYSHTIEFEDAEQEAFILLGTKADLKEAATDPDLGMGVLAHRLYSDLVDKVKYEAVHRSEQVSYERLREGHE